MRLRSFRGLLAATAVLLGLLAGTGASAGDTTGPAGRIAFGRATADGRYDLWTIAPTGRGLRRMTASCGWDWGPAWSPDARRVAFTRGCGAFEPGKFDLDLYVVGANGTGLRRLVRTATKDEHPAWSPDGRRIAFVSGAPFWQQPGGPGEEAAELWVVGADGRGVRRLTRNGVPDGSPAWSPDGTRIAFSSRRGGTNVIHLVPARGGAARSLGLRGGEPAWSPDGKRLAYASRNPAFERETVDLYVANADGSAVRRLTRERTGVVSHHPSWSPDGRSLVFSSNRADPAKAPSLWLVPAAGGGPRRLTSHAYEDLDPAWHGPPRAPTAP